MDVRISSHPEFKLLILFYVQKFFQALLASFLGNFTNLTEKNIVLKPNGNILMASMVLPVGTLDRMSCVTQRA